MADNKKLREKNQKDAAAVKKKQQDYQNERKGRMVQVAEAHKSLLERANKAIQDGNSEQAKGLKERASHFAKVLNGAGRQLSNDYLKSILDASEQQDLDSKQNLDAVRQAVEKQTAEDIKATRKAEAAAKAAPLSKGLSNLSENIARANAAEVAREKLGDNTMGKRLNALGSVFGKAVSKADIARAKELKELNAKVTEALETATAGGNEEEIALAQQQVDALDDTVSSEEQRREQSKKSDAANSTLEKIRGGVEGFNSKLGDMAKGGGFVAGLAGVVLALFSPETFVKIVNTAIEKVMVIVDFVKDLFELDLAGAFETFKENLGLFAAIAGGILLYFGPALIGGIISVVNVVKTVGLFMKLVMFPTITTMFATISSTFTGMMAGLSTMILALGPIPLIIAGALAAIGVILFGFNKLKESLGPGAGILDTLKVAALYFVDFLSMIVNGLTFIPRKMISFLGKRAAKWLLGDDVDTSALEALSEGLDTGRGKRAADEIRKKNEEAAAQKKLEESREQTTGDTSTSIDEGALGFNSAEATAAYEAAMAQVNSGKMSGTTQVNAAQSSTINSSNVVHVNTDGAQSSRALQLPALG